MKKFRDIKEGEEVFVLNPKTGEVEPLKVLSSLLHPKSRNKATWILKTTPIMDEKYKDSVTQEKLKMANKMGVANTSMTLLIQGDLTLTMIMTDPVPTVLSTDQTHLEKWMIDSEKNMNSGEKKFLQMIRNRKIDYHSTPRKKKP